MDLLQFRHSVLLLIDPQRRGHKCDQVRATAQLLARRGSFRRSESSLGSSPCLHAAQQDIASKAGIFIPSRLHRIERREIQHARFSAPIATDDANGWQVRVSKHSGDTNCSGRQAEEVITGCFNRRFTMLRDYWKWRNLSRSCRNTQQKLSHTHDSSSRIRLRLRFAPIFGPLPVTTSTRIPLLSPKPTASAANASGFLQVSLSKMPIRQTRSVSALRHFR